jgi:hypothetical protein
MTCFRPGFSVSPSLVSLLGDHGSYCCVNYLCNVMLLGDHGNYCCVNYLCNVMLLGEHGNYCCVNYLCNVMLGCTVSDLIVM